MKVKLRLLIAILAAPTTLCAQLTGLERQAIVEHIADNMVRVEGGTFQMGSNSGDDAAKPVHPVTLSSFSICRFEVTQREWKAVMGNEPSFFKASDDLPIENVSWTDCQDFLAKLNQMTGKHYRLPTEAEWEFEARGGNLSRGYDYAGDNDIKAVAWYEKNSGNKAHPVGTKTPNELGLYDMSGNVWEWCSDLYGSYGSSSQTNPKGASQGSLRVVRGGSWGDGGKTCRVSNRYGDSPDNLGGHILGLRLAL